MQSESPANDPEGFFGNGTIEELLRRENIATDQISSPPYTNIKSPDHSNIPPGGRITNDAQENQRNKNSPYPNGYMISEDQPKSPEETVTTIHTNNSEESPKDSNIGTITQQTTENLVDKTLPNGESQPFIKYNKEGLELQDVSIPNPDNVTVFKNESQKSDASLGANTPNGITTDSSINTRKPTIQKESLQEVTRKDGAVNRDGGQSRKEPKDALAIKIEGEDRSAHRIGQPQPLVVQLPKLEAHIQTSGNLTDLKDLKYSPSGLPTRKPDALPPLNLQINGGKDNTIGTSFKTYGGVIFNHHVDLTNGLPSTVTITDSSRENQGNKMQIVWLLVILGVLLSAGLVSTALLLPRSQDRQTGQGDDDAPANYTLRLIKRGQWSAHTDTEIGDLLVKPPKLVLVEHTVSSFCTKTPICMNIVQSMESWHIQVGYGAIGYNFMIGGDGYIYEGRGWGKEGAHAYGFNCNSIGVAFIGNFDKDELTPSMLKAFEILIEEGLRENALTPDYKLLGHYQVKETDSPGQNIKKVIKSWPHWSGQVTEDENICQKLRG